MYEQLKEKDFDPFKWTPDCDQEFLELKNHLMRVPALALPDLSCPFHQYVYGKGGTALGVLTQKLGPLTQVVAYFSKQLDQTAKGWSPHLWAVAATSQFLKEANKLTFGQPLTVWTPHCIRAGPCETPAWKPFKQLLFREERGCRDKGGPAKKP